MDADGSVDPYGWQHGLWLNTSRLFVTAMAFLVATYYNGVFREEDQFVGRNPHVQRERVAALFEDRRKVRSEQTGGMIQLWDGDFTSLTARDGLTQGIAVSAYADDEDKNGLVPRMVFRGLREGKS